MFEERIDNIVGIAYAMDMLEFVEKVYSNLQFFFFIYLFYTRIHYILLLFWLTNCLLTFEGREVKRSHCEGDCTQANILCAR